MQSAILILFLVQSQKIKKIHGLLILYHTRRLSNIVKQDKKIFNQGIGREQGSLYLLAQDRTLQYKLHPP
jgi:hypothetical protein